MGDVLRRAQAAQGRFLSQLRQYLRRQGIQHIRADDPGATQLTRGGWGPASGPGTGQAEDAALVQEYVTSQLAPRWPQMEEMFTMQPVCWWSIRGSTAWMVWNAPSTLTEK